MAPMFDTREPSIDALRNGPCYFRFGSSRRRVLVDGLTAQAVLAVYDGLKPDNQAKLDRMIKTPAGLSKIADFAWKVVGIA